MQAGSECSTAAAGGRPTRRAQHGHEQGVAGSTTDEPQCGGSIKLNQIKAIYGLAGRRQLDPQKLVHERFDRYVPEDLTIREASELLDELQQEHGVARHST